MKSFFRMDVKELLIALARDSEREKKMLFLILIEVMLAMIALCFSVTAFLLIAMLTFLTYFFNQTLEVMKRRTNGVLRNNSFSHILMSDKKFATSFLFWGVEFPLIFTGINLNLYFSYQNKGMATIFVRDEITSGDWLIILIFFLVLVVNRKLGQWISRRCEKTLVL